jgi:3-isopropylmalate/(R)-2-methylmalate dehydratase large subunit
MLKCPAQSRLLSTANSAPCGPKDLILYLIGKLTAEGANYRVLEFHGDTIRAMSTSGRLVICNMSVEAGATSGIVPVDEETLRYLKMEAGVTDKIEIFGADPDAVYEQTIEIDVSKLAPQIACPHTVDNVRTVDQVAGIKIDRSPLQRSSG